MEAPGGGGVDAGPVEAEPHILVRTLGGDREWRVPDVHGDLTASAVRRHLVVHGGFSRLDRLVLLVGPRPLSSAETVRTALAQSQEGHVTLVRCDQSWLADERAVLAGKYLKAALDGALSPTSGEYHANWTAATAPEVSAEELEELVRRAFCEEGLAQGRGPTSVEEFMLLFGALLQSYGGPAHMFHPPWCHQTDDAGWKRFPLFFVRCTMFWALAFATPGEVEASWPFLLPTRGPDGSVVGATFLRPPACDVYSRLRALLAGTLRASRHLPAVELEGVDRAHFAGHGRGLANGAPLEARVALAALRVCARVDAGLNVVLLGGFPAREDVAVCELASQLMRQPGRRPQGRRSGPRVHEHEVAELPEDLRPLLEAQGERPLTLLRALGDARDTSRLAHLAAAAGGRNSRTVWSVRTGGATPDHLLSLVAQVFGEAAAIAL